MTRLLVRGGYALALLLALAFAWVVRDQPLQPEGFGNLVRLDALGAFFGLLTLAAALLASLDGAHAGRTALAAAILLLAYATSHLLLIGLGYLLATFVIAFGCVRTRDVISLVADLLAPVSLLLAYSALWLNSGAWHYDLPAVASALDSSIFWLVLLATVVGGNPLLRDMSTGWIRVRWPRLWLEHSGDEPDGIHTTRLVWALPWLYPLLRLYSLGPWNAGWSLATLLLGSGLAVWCAARSVTSVRGDWVIGSLFGLALAGAGLSSAAGVATCCYSLLCALLLALGLKRVSYPAPAWSPTLLWALCGALPITMPFVALWLGIGAATAGGVLLVAGAFWLAGFSIILAVIRLQIEERRAVSDRNARTTPTYAFINARFGWMRLFVQRRVLAAVLSVAGGVLAPLVMQWPIMPVARQLGGGLTPFGDIAIWPWVGLATLDSARQPVASLPSLAVGALMLVLSALAWLVLRLAASRNQHE